MKVTKIGLLEIPVEQIISRNESIAKNSNSKTGYFAQTTKYSTFSGNRTSVETIIYHAIVRGDKHLNKTPVEKFSTDLVLRGNPTKSTVEKHHKKLVKISDSYPGITILPLVEIT